MYIRTNDSYRSFSVSDVTTGIHTAFNSLWSRLHMVDLCTHCREYWVLNPKDTCTKEYRQSINNFIVTRSVTIPHLSDCSFMGLVIASSPYVCIAVSAYMGPPAARYTFNDTYSGRKTVLAPYPNRTYQPFQHYTTSSCHECNNLHYTAPSCSDFIR